MIFHQSLSISTIKQHRNSKERSETKYYRTGKQSTITYEKGQLKTKTSFTLNPTVHVISFLAAEQLTWLIYCLCDRSCIGVIIIYFCIYQIFHAKRTHNLSENYTLFCPSYHPRLFVRFSMIFFYFYLLFFCLKTDVYMLRFVTEYSRWFSMSSKWYLKSWTPVYLWRFVRQKKQFVCSTVESIIFFLYFTTKFPYISKSYFRP